MEGLDLIRRRSKSLSTHSRTVLGMSATVYVVGVILLFAIWILTSTWETPDLRDALISCSTAALNSRTPGFPLHAELLVSRPLQWVIVLLMMIGAAPAGTGGGIKVTTVAMIGRGVGDALRGRAGRAFGLAIVWVGIYLLIVLCAFLALVALQPQMPADRLFFLTISAMSNVGLSHDPVSITGPGLYVLSVTMLLGRFAPLGMLWWAARTTEGLEIACA
jgi:trk system potassium uptake protein TrkH